MNCLVFIRAYCGFRRINLHGINVSFIIYCMFASNNKPSKRSARAERKAAHTSSARRIARREVLLTRMLVRLARRMLRAALVVRARMRMEPAAMARSRMFPLFTRSKRAISARLALMVRPPSVARTLLATHMIARSFALSASARRSVASASRLA